MSDSTRTLDVLSGLVVRPSLRPTRLLLRVLAGFAPILIGCGDGGTAPVDPVDPPPPPVRVVAVEVGPAAPLLEPGTRFQLQAKPKARDGSEVTGRTVTWRSGDEAVVRVTATGELTAVAAGATEVTATVDDVSGRVEVTVATARAVVASVQVEGGRPLWGGERLQLTAIARDAEGHAIAGRAVTWSTDRDAVALVDQQGLVLAVGSGEARIGATIDGVTGTARLEILGRPAHDLVYQATRSGRPSLWRYRPGSEEFPVPVFADGRYATQPAVSPDGTRIAFVGRDGDNRDVYVVNTDGTGLRRLTAAPGDDDQPAWSPDGTRIAFRSTRAGLPDIWVMDADGGNAVNLTDIGYRLGSPASAHPVWTPDGSRIVFSQGYLEAASSPRRLLSMRPDGSDLRFLTNRPGYSDDAPSFSPDGRTIAIERRAVGADASDIVLLRADGQELILLHYPGEGRAPTWSPDGQWIAFVDAAGEVMLTRVNEPVRRRVTEGPAFGGGDEPTWLGR